MKKYLVIGEYTTPKDKRTLHRSGEVKAENIVKAIEQFNGTSRTKLGAITAQVNEVYQLVWCKF